MDEATIGAIAFTLPLSCNFSGPVVSPKSSYDAHCRALVTVSAVLSLALNHLVFESHCQENKKSTSVQNVTVVLASAGKGQFSFLW
jgi:hypothetical protein